MTLRRLVRTGHRGTVVAFLLALAGLAHASVALAEDPDALDGRTATTLMVGGALAFVPLAIGGTMVANTSDATVRRASVYVSSAGFTVAPLVAHGLMGEWGRGSAFAALPLACGVGLAILMQEPKGDVLSELATTSTRVPFWAMASTELAVAVFGIVDAALAPDRARRRAIYLVPGPVRSGAGISLGGAL
jgi:hypothetical protein